VGRLRENWPCWPPVLVSWMIAVPFRGTVRAPSDPWL
jgi:hypothetical protein